MDGTSCKFIRTNNNIYNLTRKELIQKTIIAFLLRLSERQFANRVGDVPFPVETSFKDI